MRLTKRLGLGAASVLAAARASAQTTSCPEGGDNICFSWGVPEAAISSGSGNVYFQLSAPTKYSWAGLGIGNRMAGSQMFLMYQDGTGNVTLSTRDGEGHRMPQYSSMPDVELLAGSGVESDTMVANVRCTQCDNLDLSGKSNWIAAWLEGDAADSSDPEAPINMHDGYTSFTVDMSQASVSSDSNPFADSRPTSGGSGSGGNDSGTGSGGGVVETDGGAGSSLIHAHGIIMSIVFVVGYPVGAMLMPLVRVWYIHSTFQIIVFLGMWAGFATGYITARQDGNFWDQSHTRIGTIVTAMMALQPVLGWLHHWQYQRIKSRTAFSYAHIWYGRSLMILGVVNGGLGLDLSGAKNEYKIAYAVVAAVIGVAYIFASLFGSWRRRRIVQREKMSPISTN